MEKGMLTCLCVRPSPLVYGGTSSSHVQLLILSSRPLRSCSPQPATWFTSGECNISILCRVSHNLLHTCTTFTEPQGSSLPILNMSSVNIGLVTGHFKLFKQTFWSFIHVCAFIHFKIVGKLSKIKTFPYKRH